MTIKNAKAKGNRVQRKLITQLESEGWTVAVVERTSRHIKVKDMFGMFDLCCIHDDGGVMFAQVTCNKPHVHKHYQKFSKKFVRTHVTFSQYVWLDYHGWKQFTYYDGDKFRVKGGGND